MAYVIRNLETGFDFSKGHWVPDQLLAEQFADEEEVQNIFNKHRWESVEIAFLDKSGKRIAGGTRIKET